MTKEYESYYNNLDDLGKLYDQRANLLFSAAECERVGKKTEWFEKQIAMINLQIREKETPGSLQ